MSGTGWQEDFAHSNHSGTQTVGIPTSVCALTPHHGRGGKTRVQQRLSARIYLAEACQRTTPKFKRVKKVRSYYLVGWDKTGIFMNSSNDYHNANFLKMYVSLITKLPNLVIFLSEQSDV